MSRIRTIKPAFWTSEQVVECSLPARLLFIGMWNFADDNGVMPASAKQLKMQVYPGDDFKVADVLAMVDELKAQRLIAEFSYHGRCYWFITGWKHQKIDRPTPSDYPPPPADGLGSAADGSPPPDVNVGDVPSVDHKNLAIDEPSTSIRRAIDEESSWKGKEGNRGEESKGQEGRGEEWDRKEGSTAVDAADAASPADTGSTAKAEPKSARLWEAYALSYQDRYGVEPVRNAKVNRQLCQVVDRLGREAPAVAGFYVRHNNAWYVKRGHAVDCLLADCEKLRTEWATGQQITAAHARNLDQHQTTVSLTERLIEKFRREGKLIEEPAHAS